VAPQPVPVVAQGPLQELLADYRRYLLIERGLSDHTVFDAYEPAARLFLTAVAEWHGLGLDRLRATQVSSFLASECPKRSVSGARDLVCALRSLLRYLHVAGLIKTPLVWAVPSVADLRDRGLPRGLEPPQLGGRWPYPSDRSPHHDGTVCRMIECASAPARNASVTNPARSECPASRAVCAGVNAACSARRLIISFTACPVIAVEPMAPVLCTVGNNARPASADSGSRWSGSSAAPRPVLFPSPTAGGGGGGGVVRGLPAEHRHHRPPSAAGEAE
jgi:hypothetical protein